MKHRLELPQENEGIGWFIAALDAEDFYLRKDGNVLYDTGWPSGVNDCYFDTYEQAFKAREAYLSDYKRPTHEEEYVGTDKRYTEEKEDEAFENLEKKLNSTRPNVAHYLQGQIEPIDFINSHGFNFNLGNAIKYITRCNHKGTKKEDLQKAIDYIRFELENVR